MRSKSLLGDLQRHSRCNVSPLNLHTISGYLFALLTALVVTACGSSNSPAPISDVGASIAAPTTMPMPMPPGDARSSLALANAAFRENRIVAPAGSNALEHALHALQQDANDAGTNEILVDITPIAASAIEASIAAGNLAEAERVMALLTSANPNSLTVQGLRRRMAAATRPVVAPTLSALPPESVLDAEVTGISAAPTPSLASFASDTENASIPPAATTAVALSQGTPANRTENTSAEPLAAATTPQRAAPVMDSTATSPSSTSEPVALVRVSPDYPAAAKKRRTEGWVELQFLVGVDGVPRQIEVLRAQPPSMFDRAAVRAVSRWKFKPAERGGASVEALAKTTVGFKLG
ncbi:MAG: energy transducer TonB [Pseudomonadota bacterium]|nr:energy transducer TonB [Pseudomonadota bacterium]